MVNTLIGVANKVGVNSLLLVSICNVETGMKSVNNYKDHKGPSYGIAQIKLSTARSVEPVVDILALQQPQVNAGVAAKLLKRLEKKYGNKWDAVAAYNAGSLRYKNGVLINKKYVDKVRKNYYHLDKKLCLLKGKYDSHKVQKGKCSTDFKETYSLSKQVRANRN